MLIAKQLVDAPASANAEVVLSVSTAAGFAPTSHAPTLSQTAMDPPPLPSIPTRPSPPAPPPRAINYATEWLDEDGRVCPKNVDYSTQCPKGHALGPCAAGGFPTTSPWCRCGRSTASASTTAPPSRCPAIRRRCARSTGNRISPEGGLAKRNSPSVAKGHGGLRDARRAARLQQSVTHPVAARHIATWRTTP